MDKKVTMTIKELKRVEVIGQIESGQLTARIGAEILCLSIRQTRRLIARYRQQGAVGMMHGNRGKPPANRVPEEVRQKIEKLCCEEYEDYNDSHLTEILVEKHGIGISRSSVRRIRRSIGQGSPRKRRAPRHRSRRDRKPKAGMLLQTDGSHHDWLEGRGPALVLIVFIDDATNEVMGAVFRLAEDAAGYFLGLQEICLQRGIPAAIYADLHTIFRSPKKPTMAQELNGEQPLSQFGRLANELGIELILAHSPQAKGRVERLFGTLQDRLVKALREAGASTLAEANQVLSHYLPKHNQRFKVKPVQDSTAYVPWPKEYRPQDYFCFKHQRIVANDNTISFSGHRLQIPPGPKRISFAKSRVDVLQHLDGNLEIRYKQLSLITFQPADNQPVRIAQFTPLIKHQQKTIVNSVQKTAPRKSSKPAPDHPWRRYGKSLPAK
jgi:transposase